MWLTQELCKALGMDLTCNKLIAGTDGSPCSTDHCPRNGHGDWGALGHIVKLLGGLGLLVGARLRFVGVEGNCKAPNNLRVDWRHAEDSTALRTNKHWWARYLRTWLG